MPHSIALLHYPYLVYRGDQKKLWDPIRRKAFKIQPEERVRQRLLNCFIHERLYPKSRISTESGMQSPDTAIQRTDILCYEQSFNPHLLVECKAENIKITEDAAIQIARYNQQIGAPFLLLTNGVVDFWYKADDDLSHPLEHPPSPFQITTSEPPPQYWVDRGFIGNNTPSSFRKELGKILFRYWIEKHQGESSITYLNFRRHPEHMNLNHYYRLTKVRQTPPIRVALAFMKSRDDHSHLAGIINREKENIGFIDINLTFLSRQINENMWVYTAGKQDVYNANETLSIRPGEIGWFEPIAGRMANWYFETYSDV